MELPHVRPDYPPILGLINFILQIKTGGLRINGGGYLLLHICLHNNIRHSLRHNACTCEVGVAELHLSPPQNSQLVMDPTHTSERKHVLDLIWAYTARQSVSKEAKEHLDEMPGPSFTQTFAQLRGLVERSRGLGDLRAIPTQVLHWENPAQTLTFLILYTGLCLHPQILAVVPLASVLVGVFIPNYARKFPTSVDYLPQPVAPNEYEEPAPEAVASHEVAERDIVAAVREGQASIERICVAFDKFDQFKAGPGNFEEPEVSSALFVVLLGLVATLAYLATFMSITWLFISSGWLVVTLSYPPLKLWLAQLEPIPIELKLVPQLVALLRRSFEFDEPLLVRQVEIFELQKEGLTPRIWDTVLFTPFVYSATSPYRLSHQFPPGAPSLVEVSPPKDWVFKEDSTWAEDPDSAAWIKDRRVVGVTSDGPWAYDIDLGWRRRRLVKNCFYMPK